MVAAPSCRSVESLRAGVAAQRTGASPSRRARLRADRHARGQLGCTALASRPRLRNLGPTRVARQPPWRPRARRRPAGSPQGGGVGQGRVACRRCAGRARPANLRHHAGGQNAAAWPPLPPPSQMGRSRPLPDAKTGFTRRHGRHRGSQRKAAPPPEVGGAASKPPRAGRPASPRAAASGAPRDRCRAAFRAIGQVACPNPAALRSRPARGGRTAGPSNQQRRASERATTVAHNRRAGAATAGGCGRPDTRGRAMPLARPPARLLLRPASLRRPAGGTARPSPRFPFPSRPTMGSAAVARGEARRPRHARDGRAAGDPSARVPCRSIDFDAGRPGAEHTDDYSAGTGCAGGKGNERTRAVHGRRRRRRRGAAAGLGAPAVARKCTELPPSAPNRRRAHGDRADPKGGGSVLAERPLADVVDLVRRVPRGTAALRILVLFVKERHTDSRAP